MIRFRVKDLRENSPIYKMSYFQSMHSLFATENGIMLNPAIYVQGRKKPHSNSLI